jgi:Phage tail tube protein
MPLLSRKRLILAKVETTYGTDPTPTGAANAILVRNLDIKPIETDVAERDLIRPYLGGSDRLTAATRMMVEFECELFASGTLGTVPQVSPLLRACAMAETVNAGVSVVYKPVSASFESCTIYAYVDGKLHKGTGCRGTFSCELTNKQIPVLKFQLTGLFQAVTDTALATPTYSAQVPLVVNNLNTTTFTFHGFAAVASQMAFDLGNSVVHRSLIGGTESVLVSDRKASGSMMIESVLQAQKDFYTIAKNSTPGALTVTHGTVNGQKVQIDCPAVPIVKMGYADMDGIQMDQFDLALLPSSAGNDELQFTFK